MLLHIIFVVIVSVNNLSTFLLQIHPKPLKRGEAARKQRGKFATSNIALNILGYEEKSEKISK